jgi:hypothetical protein
MLTNYEKAVEELDYANKEINGLTWQLSLQEQLIKDLRKEVANLRDELFQLKETKFT